MADANELYRAGKLDEAIEALGASLRDNPADSRRRTFLFELLCFAGKFERAEKQLDILAQNSREAEMGALLYRSALHAERTRQEMFLSGNRPDDNGRRVTVSGTLNGKPFSTLVDADPRIGPRLEVFVAGQYTWIPLEHLALVQMGEPTRLRDLLWAPARVQAGPGFQGIELGEVLTPVMAPLSWQETDDEVRLGRVTDWKELEDGTVVPVGQKLLMVDDEPFPILELRSLEIAPASEQNG